MADDYGKMELSNEMSIDDNDGNGVRQLFKTFDNSRQLGEFNQYGLDNQYDLNVKISSSYNSFFGGEKDDN